MNFEDKPVEEWLGSLLRSCPLREQSAPFERLLPCTLPGGTHQTPHQPQRCSPESKALDFSLLFRQHTHWPSSRQLASSYCNSLSIAIPCPWDILYSQLFHLYLVGLDTRLWEFNSWSCWIEEKKKIVSCGYKKWQRTRERGIFKLKMQEAKEVQDFNVFWNVMIWMFSFMHFKRLGMAIL